MMRSWALFSLSSSVVFFVTADIFQTPLHSTVLLIVFFCSVFVPSPRPLTGFPAEPDEKQKEMQNNTISEGKFSGFMDLCVQLAVTLLE